MEQMETELSFLMADLPPNIFEVLQISCLAFTFTSLFLQSLCSVCSILVNMI